MLTDGQREMNLIRPLLFVCIALAPVAAFPADNAAALITTRELQSHIETLAADSLEGREAGRRGGQATTAYLLSELKRLDLQPGGVDGSFVQEFDNGYRNILAIVPGSDERLREEVVVIGAHFDHVGYGNPDNSNGPIGQIHNGADDNASGTAALLELVEAFSMTEPRPKRTLLFAFWDAEEKGLLGSEYWISNPTVPRSSIVFSLNFDMLGRLRNRKLEIYGVRTATGLRRLLSEQNRETDLVLAFDWTQRNDSDHWSFYKRSVPYLMLHTGLHGEYHRPSDDAHLINTDGLRDVTAFSQRLVTAIADAPAWQFRGESKSETNDTDRKLSAPLAQPPSRLGLRWDGARAAKGEFIVTAVLQDSPALSAGLQPGDRITAINGVVPRETRSLRKLVLAAPTETKLTIIRGQETLDIPVRLAGSQVRVGLTWRSDPAEPGVVIVRGVIDASPSEEAGLRVGDRILAVNGQPFADTKAFHAAFLAAGTRPELQVERAGRLWTTVVELGAASK